MAYIVTTLLLLASSAAARTCIHLSIPVDISSRQGVFKKIPVESNLDIAAFAQNFNRGGQNYSDALLTSFQTLKGQYQISGKFCHPDGGVKSSVVQLLSHGIAFDKSYWDLSFENYKYSYVETVVNSGYSTLAIDRFGIGNSSHGEPFNVVQAQAEVEALNAITTKLRKGEIKGIDHKFKKVVHVGHSFGSIQSYWLSSLYPNNTDGLILTGWSPTGAYIFNTIAGWNLHSARLNQPLRFGNSSNKGFRATFKPYASGNSLITGLQSLFRTIGIKLSTQEIWDEVATTEVGDLINGYNTTVTQLNYPSGYITHSDLTANQYVFLLRGFYDTELGRISEITKQPLTIGEMLTIGNAPPSSSFKGPVLAVTGEQDQPFCGGNCFAVTDSSAPSIPAQGAKLFPNASVFEAHIQINTGHGINAHYNSTAAYKVIQSFLGANGLKA